MGNKITQENKELILFTSGFPFTKDEPFLNEEIHFHIANWSKVSVFCVSNSSKLSSEQFPAIEVYPNRFSYKSKNRFGVILKYWKSLAQEILLLIRKGILSKLGVFTVSTFFQSHAMAKWFANEHIKPEKEYIIYCYWGNQLCLTAELIAMFCKNVKVVTRVHGFDVYEIQTAHSHVSWQRFLVEHIGLMMPDSQAGCNYLHQKYPAFKNQIRTNYCGFYSEKLNPVPDSSCFRIVTCSFIRGVKRLTLLPPALEKLKFPVKWTVIGDGSGLPELREMCSKLPENIEVEFVGFKTQQQFMKIYASGRFHFLVSLSKSEGLPVSMIECISFGIPIISTDVGGCNEIVNEVTGLLIPKDFTADYLAKQLEKAYENYNYSLNYRESIRKFWNEHFNSHKNYNAVSKMMLEMCGTN
ncbi:MAG: hypothetical protein COA57_01790 [Flavobacteriales bacterium]|nr:MAG: hypothetical protein COA57_01790 [Flavobacteriales bacterium]